MKINMKSIVLAGVGVLFFASFALGNTLSLTKDDAEHLSVPLPDGWVSGTEDGGSDFITHSLTMRSASGDQHVRLGWLNTPTVPSRLSDDVVASFKSNLQDWVKAHNAQALITGDKPLTVGVLPAHFVRLEVNGSDAKKYIDFYLVLGDKAVYVLSVTHPADDSPDVSDSFTYVALQNEATARQDAQKQKDDDQREAAAAQERLERYQSNDSSSSDTSDDRGGSSSSSSSFHFPIFTLIRIGVFLVLGAGGAFARMRSRS